MAKLGRAVKFKGVGGPEVLHIADVEVPAPGAGQVLVEVAAAGLNRADLLQRRGGYPAPPGAPADIPGLEYSGTVAALGPGVVHAGIGDRVMGIVGGGAMSTFVVVHERELVPVPKGMELETAAAIPEAFMTAFDAMFSRGTLRMGEWMLVHAAGSGVGTAALQLGQACGARCMGTSRSESKVDRLRDLGLGEFIHVTDGEFAPAVNQITGGSGADVILDFVGADYVAENVKAAATLGRIVVIGLMSGVQAELPLGSLLRKRLCITGTVLRSRPLEEKADLAQRFAAQVVPLFEQGRVKPILDRIMPMTEISAAHERMEANHTFGKVVLSWGTSGSV